MSIDRIDVVYNLAKEIAQMSDESFKANADKVQEALCHTSKNLSPVKYPEPDKEGKGIKGIKEFKEELAVLLKKYGASIRMRKNENYPLLLLIVRDEIEVMDFGSSDLRITADTLERK